MIELYQDGEPCLVHLIGIGQKLSFKARIKGGGAMSMITHRENLLSVITGETLEHLKWVLHIDLWHNAQETRLTNPAHFEGMRVEDIRR